MFYNIQPWNRNYWLYALNSCKQRSSSDHRSFLHYRAGYRHLPDHRRRNSKKPTKCQGVVLCSLWFKNFGLWWKY